MIFKDIRFKISVLGIGNVGTAIAQLLLGTRDFPLEINLVDPSPWAKGSLLDLAHACTAIGLHDIHINDQQKLEEADLIFHTAGVNSKRGTSRHTVAAENIELTKSIFAPLSLSPHCRIIVIPNPVDVISYFTWKYSGLPASQVIGTGTLLDSHRLQWYLSHETECPLHETEAWVLGEHGQTMTPIFSRSYCRLMPSYALSEEKRKKLYRLTRDSATTIRKTAPATKWAVAACAVELMRAFLDPPIRTLVASVLTDAHFSQRLKSKPIYIGLPVRFSEEGCFPDPGFTIDDQECESLKSSATSLSKAIFSHI